jgi:hypothetical protein
MTRYRYDGSAFRKFCIGFVIGRAEGLPGRNLLDNTTALREDLKLSVSEPSTYGASETLRDILALMFPVETQP